MAGEPPDAVRRTAERPSDLAAEEVGRVLDDEERRQPRRDLAEVPPGGPHRVGGESRVERRPVVEVHRGDEARSVSPPSAPLTRWTRVARRPGVWATSGMCSDA